MKFIRSGRIRDKIVDFISKALLLALTVLFCLWMVSGAKAAEITDIKQEALANGGYAVELKFSEAIAKENINVEYERNFIQVSIKGLNAFPAKTKTLNYSLLDKAFTYQYQPDLARARILLKTLASNVQKKSNWEITDSGIKIIFNGGTVSQAAAPVAQTKEKDTVKVKASSTTEAPLETDDDKIVKQIIQDAKEPNKASAPVSTANQALNYSAGSTNSASATANTKIANSEDTPLFSSASNASGVAGIEAKDKKNPATKIFAVLLMIIGIIGAGALAFRRFMQGKGIGFQKGAKLIDIVSSQAMGPKRSIAIVKVLDQYMVIGMAGDNMNLLANLGSNVNIDKQIDDFGPGASFSKTFQGAMSTDVEPAAPTTTTQKKSGNDGIRDLIKKRIEGFKPL